MFLLEGLGPLMPHTLRCPVGLTPSAGSPAFDFLHIAQHNCLGSLLVFQLFFQELVTSSRRPSFVLIKEPPLRRGAVRSFGGFTCFHPPLSLGRPRMATYVDSAVARGLSVSSVPTTSPLVIEVVLSSPSCICTPAQSTLRVINVYNPPRPQPPWPHGSTPPISFPLVLPRR